MASEVRELNGWLTEIYIRTIKDSDASPKSLILACRATHARVGLLILLELDARGDDDLAMRLMKVMAMPFSRKRGYKEEWRPDVDD